MVQQKSGPRSSNGHLVLIQRLRVQVIPTGVGHLMPQKIQTVSQEHLFVSRNNDKLFCGR